ncbi:deoxyribodipyrimidine photo-lyase [Herbaspirillum sp. Sphag1AN]|uniref:DASH family cryptochrome n=1 Tax=unclassified Herbaspirillum TaxID=2624150 RepID=UPI001622C601|nr:MULTISPECIES: DASH family cryptochrome [unclassified Herbaspirillum]MBB3212099.1 deoxyribodipyrimidine photo-lyase [Herbaspirillum sp. Sphag1AN]MBB3244067.1 deoxyribodipyrimidine photo-lyase [Herbaspirillum sp. Sphag64]
MTTLLYWFRNDLRLHDNPTFGRACEQASQLVPVYCRPPETTTEWGFARRGVHRQTFTASALQGLQQQLQARHSDLLILDGEASELLPALAAEVGASGVICEDIAAPEEQQQVQQLQAQGLTVDAVWQSSLLDYTDLTQLMGRQPASFTVFRQRIEGSGLQIPLPLDTLQQLPPLPASLPSQDLPSSRVAEVRNDPRSSFPYATAACDGTETTALQHLHQYLERKLPHSYKQTRNGLSGLDFSSKFSPWLATGALSARTIYAALQQFEQVHGANEGSYWLWFELLWRDYFRFIHLQYGKRLYHYQGLRSEHALAPKPATQIKALTRWCAGQTGEPLVDAGMRELAATGYLSNRLRQIVASYWIHDLGGDWRAGAAWFEAQLVDYDVYSNHGNWLYIAGRGTDPRGGRRFYPQKQAREHDPQGHYQSLWSATT